MIRHQCPCEDRMAVLQDASRDAPKHYGGEFHVLERSISVDGTAHHMMRASRLIEPRMVTHASIVHHHRPKRKCLSASPVIRFLAGGNAGNDVTDYGRSLMPGPLIQVVPGTDGRSRVRGGRGNP